MFLLFHFALDLHTVGKQEMIPGLKSDLFKYQKGIYMKRRTMATHLLIFMISEELRNKKPYAIPVRIMPVTTVKDLEIRTLQVQLKTAMEEEGMEVVGEFLRYQFIVCKPKSKDDIEGFLHHRHNLLITI